MESSIAVFLLRYLAFELVPTLGRPRIDLQSFLFMTRGFISYRVLVDCPFQNVSDRVFKIVEIAQSDQGTDHPCGRGNSTISDA